MTDEQIIKALECCRSENGNDCERCQYTKIVYRQGEGGCTNRLMQDALNLIIRQQKELEAKHAHILCLNAEVERLTEEVEIKSQKRANIFEISSAYERGRAEAITKYHEEVKKRCIEGGIYPAFVNRQMEDVRKEMVGESK